MERVSGRAEMIAGMDPVLMPGRFVFCTMEDGLPVADALATFREAEGLSVLLPVERAEALGLPVESPMRQITLRVYSPLDGVG